MDELILRTQSFQELKGLSVVIPCHKENPSLVTEIYCELKMLGAEVIIVDDGQTMDFDDSIDYHTYQPHMGYGYAIKEGVKKSTNTTICTIDSDGQHSVEDVCKMYTVFNLINDCKMLVGCRWNLNEKPHRWIGRKCLNFLASCIAGHYLIDLNSGMRIFTRTEAIGYSPILCDTFSFTTSLTMSMVTDGHKIAWFPIDVKPRKYGKSHVKVMKDGFITLYYIIWIGLALRTRKIREWIRHILGR